MALRFVMARRGAVRVSTARFVHLSEDAFLFHVDCAQKRPESMVDVAHEGDDGDEVVVRVVVYPSEETLHVPEDAPRDEHGMLASTVLELRGLVGEWCLMSEDGKWGPYVCGFRAVPRDASWPEYADSDGVEEVGDAGREEG